MEVANTIKERNTFKALISHTVLYTMYLFLLYIGRTAGYPTSCQVFKYEHCGLETIYFKCISTDTHQIKHYYWKDANGNEIRGTNKTKEENGIGTVIELKAMENIDLNQSFTCYIQNNIYQTHSIKCEVKIEPNIYPMDHRPTCGTDSGDDEESFPYETEGNGTNSRTNYNPHTRKSNSGHTWSLSKGMVMFAVLLYFTSLRFLNAGME